MSLGRDYVVTFEKVSVSAVQDLFQLKGASGKVCLLVEFEINDVDSTAPTDQQLAMRVRYLPATVTDGSGGSSPTPAVTDPGEAAASFTAKANNTTQATTNGTAVTRWEGGGNVKAGVPKRFEVPFPFSSGESLTIELITTPASTLTLSGTARVREIGA